MLKHQHFFIISVLFATSCGGPAIVLPNEKALLQEAQQPPETAVKSRPEPATETTAIPEEPPVLPREVPAESSQPAARQLPPAALQAYKEASHFFLTGQYEASQKKLENALEISPDYVEAYLLLAKVLLQKSIGGTDAMQLEAARQNVEIGLKIAPENIEARQLLELLSGETEE